MERRSVATEARCEECVRVGVTLTPGRGAVCGVYIPQPVNMKPNPAVHMSDRAKGAFPDRVTDADRGTLFCPLDLD